MFLLDYVYLKLVNAVDDLELDNDIIVKPIVHVKNPDVAYANYVLLYELSTSVANAHLGGYDAKEIGYIRCDVRTSTERDLEILSRRILETFKSDVQYRFVSDEVTSYKEVDMRDGDYILSTLSENIVELTVPEDFTLDGNTVVKLIFDDGYYKYYYVWRVDGYKLTLFGFDGYVYFAQVDSTQNLSDKRRGVYRRLIDVEVRAFV